MFCRRFTIDISSSAVSVAFSSMNVQSRGLLHDGTQQLPPSAAGGGGEGRSLQGVGGQGRGDILDEGLREIEVHDGGLPEQETRRGAPALQQHPHVRRLELEHHG